MHLALIVSSDAHAITTFLFILIVLLLLIPAFVVRLTEFNAQGRCNSKSCKRASLRFHAGDDR